MKNPRSRPRAIDKNLAQQARVLDKLSYEGFEKAVTEARANVAHRRARPHTFRRHSSSGECGELRFAGGIRRTIAVNFHAISYGCL